MNTKRTGAALTALLGIVLASSLRADAQPAGALTQQDYNAAFRASDYNYCLVCHGSLGQGNEAIQAPAIAGMEFWSVRNQLEAFRRGWRGKHPEDLVGMEMQPIAMELSELQIPEVISYVGDLAPQRSPVAVDGDAEAGRRVYQACAICHGAAAQGQQLQQAPALAYQSGSYMVRQLRHFRDGVRGAADGDMRGALMRATAQGLSDDDINNVVAYIRSLSAPQSES
jgi:cytochrome c553